MNKKNRLSFDPKNATKRLIFEPDIDLDENQMFDIENEILDIIEEKLGKEYELENWRLETKCIIIANKLRS
jgi:hypothetical protein